MQILIRNTINFLSRQIPIWCNSSFSNFSYKSRVTSFLVTKMSISTIGYAAEDSKGVLQPWKFEQRELGPEDVHVRIVACGICNTDIQYGRNLWGYTEYPFVPGHEITGYVEAVGSMVTKVKPGDKAGVGYIIDACGSCEYCQHKKEQYCAKKVFTGIGKLIKDGSVAYGGYARDIVCQEKFLIRFPENLDMYSGAPLLCAGVTVYSPMKKFGLDKPGKKLGVIGLGGLGQMAVKFGVAFGHDVTVFSRSESKRKEATTILGAQHYLNTADAQVFTDHKNSLDVIIDTVGAPKDMDAYISLLRVDGIYLILAMPEKPLKFNGLLLVDNRIIVTGSILGSVEDIEEMLKFCSEKNITCMIEKVSMDYVNTAWERVLKSDVHYRFVLDVENTCPS